MLRELIALTAAALTTKVLALAMALPAQGLLYKRFWLDEEFVILGAWLIGTAAALVTVEWVRRTPRPWPIMDLRSDLTPRYMVGVPVLTVGVAVAAAVVVEHEARWPQWSLFSEAGLAAISLLLVGALQEELLFRYVLLSSFSRILRSRLAALAVVSVLFAAVHPGQNIAFVFAAGLWFGAIAISTGSIWPAAMAHFMLNLSVQILFSRTSLASVPIYDNLAYASFQKLLAPLLLLAAAWQLRKHVKTDALYAPLSRLGRWMRQGTTH